MRVWCTVAGSASVSATARAGKPPSCRCSRPGGPRVRPVRQRAGDHQPGKSGADAEVEPDFGRPAQGRAAAASRRYGGSTARGMVPAATRLVVALPSPAAARRSGPAGRVFHVKQASAPGRGRDRRRDRAVTASRSRRGPARGRRGGDGRPASVSAAGVTPSMPAGLAEGARPLARRASASSRWTGRGPGVIVEIVGQHQALVAPERRDVLRLAVEIDRVLGVDLELGRDRRRELGRTAARSASARPRPRLGIGQQLERGAALAVAVEREAVALRPRWA